MSNIASTITPENLVAIVAIAGLVFGLIWKVGQSVYNSTTPPDPWDETTAASIENEEATPLCHKCLSPHNTSEDFCPDCGAPVGTYTNWLPYPYLFSIGHSLRIGTNGEFRRSPLTIVGFLFLSLVEFSLFVPLYWIVFLKKLHSKQLPENPPKQQPPTK